MTSHLAHQIVHVCIATMGVVGIWGLVATYIDMCNEEKMKKCLVEAIVTLAIIFFLLVIILIIQTEYYGLSSIS